MPNSTPGFTLSSLLRRREALYDAVFTRSLPFGFLVMLAAMTVIVVAGYGFIMGTFVDQSVVWMLDARRLLLTLLASFALCFPSLYIFSAFRGSQLNVRQIFSLCLVAFGVMSLTLFGFLPVAWFFTWVSETLEFVRILHGVIIAIGIILFITVLGGGLTYAYKKMKETDQHSRGALDILGLWFIVFVATIVQMSITVGPFYIHSVPIGQLTASSEIPPRQLVRVHANIVGLSAGETLSYDGEFASDGARASTYEHGTGGEACELFTDYRFSYRYCDRQNRQSNEPIPSIERWVWESTPLEQTEVEGPWVAQLAFVKALKDRGASESTFYRGQPVIKMKVDQGVGPGSAVGLLDKKTHELLNVLLFSEEAGSEPVVEMQLQNWEMRSMSPYDRDRLTFANWKTSLREPSATMIDR